MFPSDLEKIGRYQAIIGALVDLKERIDLQVVTEEVDTMIQEYKNKIITSQNKQEI